MAEQVKLLGTWGSPFSRRVEMGLKIKGVQYEYIEEDIKNKSPLLLKYNPIHKKVPVLVHNGRPIAESLVILEYIDEAWEGPSILPKDSYERAHARFLAQYVDEKGLPAIWKALWSKGEDFEKAKEESIQALNVLENELVGKKFFGGESIGLVDISANFIGHWFEVAAEIVGLQELLAQDKFPNLCNWVDSYSQCDVVKENVPDKEKLAEFFKGLAQSGYTA